MNLLKTGLFFIFITLIQSCASHQNKNLCPKIIMHSEEKFELSETEERLICGDQDSVAYKVIPSYQASYMLTGFLQSRGYSKPRFVYEGDILHVYPESKSHVKKIIVESSSEKDSQLVEKQILKHYKHDIITPKLLDDIEAESLSILRNNTYPCAKVESSVDPVEEVVTVKATGLESFQFGEVTREKIEGIEEAALDRFYPFKASDYFSEKKELLAEKRFLRSGIVQGTYFQEKCDLKNHTFSLSQQFIEGTSKTIRLGIGASTELGPMVRAKWSNQRAGAMASLLEASAQLSFKNQYLNFLSERYMWKNAPRRSFVTSLEIEHDDQETFEEFTTQLKPHLKWTRDGANRLWTWSTGPTLIAGSFREAANNNDTKRIKTGALEGMVQTMSHDYELFDLHPEAGDMFQFNFDFRHPVMGFDDPLLKLDLNYLRLDELMDLGKGRLISGIRFNTSTTWVANDVALSDLPPSVKFYGGGSDDVRGFKLSSLPGNNGIGALTKFSTKFEIRKTYLFIPTVESFTFLDTAFFGDRSWNLDHRFWYSPGTGIRWLSPIGMVQAYVSRGLSNKSQRDEGNFYYLGLGGVF